MSNTYAERKRAKAHQEAWRREKEHTATETRARFREVVERLALPPRLAPPVVDALMEVARYYSMECAYANYELRTGCAYPPERRESEEEQERGEWAACLVRLEASLRS
jgi:hypothetical protein